MKDESTLLKEELKYILVTSIVPNRFQPRKDFNQQDLEELAKSIDENGLLQPVVVRKLVEPAETGEIYELIAGERRWRAHKILDETRIKALITEHDDCKSAAMALIENLQRSNLSAIEQACAMRQLMTLGNFTQETIAKRIGKSRSYVANTLRLLQAPTEIQTLLSRKQLETWHVLSLLMLPPEQQIELANKTVEKGWSITTLKERVDKLTGRAEKKKEVEGKAEKEDAPKSPVPARYILIRLEDEAELENVKASLTEGGLRFFQNEDIKLEIKRATIKAIPCSAQIRYATDGSDPVSLGASKEGIQSRLEKIDIDQYRNKIVVIEPTKPLIWNVGQLGTLSAKAVFDFIERLIKYQGTAHSLIMDVFANDESAVITYSTEGSSIYTGEEIKAVLEKLQGVMKGSQVSISIEEVKFQRGQQLIDWFREVGHQIQPGEVRQLTLSGSTSFKLR